MGTIVLSPQDCLTSPHNRQNHYFPSAGRPETGRRCSQALMAPAEDCTRHDYSGGSPPGDGLLPIPQPHGQARALSKRSPLQLPTKTSSIFCTPPVRRMVAPSPSSIVKPKLSRSASAILPTPLTGTTPIVEKDLLKGRLPLKIVQENGSGNKIDVAQRSNSKKFADARNGALKNMAGGHTVNSKVKGLLDCHQGSRLTSNPPHDGAVLKGQPKKVDVRKQRSLERSSSVKVAHERRAQDVGVPVVTILQRPQNEEAAAELLTKFFQKSVEQDTVCMNEEWVDYMSGNMQNSHEMTVEREIEQRSSIVGLPDFEALRDMSCQTISSPCRTTDVLGSHMSRYGGEMLLADAVHLAASSTLVAQSDVGDFGDSKGSFEDVMLESVSEELAPWERWAGPSYINSPPPSALPLPRFPRKHSKIESLDAADLFEEVVPDQASILPSISPKYACSAGQRQLGINLEAVVSATKDLKRILNLDLCRI